MRSRTLVGLGVVAAAWLALGYVLSLATTRVRNWFVMTDELYYERRAISVAQTGSLLPRLHGEVISNVNQLYPVLSAAAALGFLWMPLTRYEKLNVDTR
jgi:hypothetical protein